MRRRISVATWMSMATASVPHLSGHASDQGHVLHPRHVARPLRALHRGRRDLTSTTCSGCCASSRPPRIRRAAPLRHVNADKPTRFGVIYYGSTSPAMNEGAEILEAQGTAGLPCASAPSRSTTWRASSLRMISSSSSSRTAMPASHAARSTRNRHRPGEADARVHYDGTPITARFIQSAVGDRASSAECPAAPQGHVMTYLAEAEAPSSEAADQFDIGLTRRDYEGSISDALRRLRS
jgi:hypothetical protein